MLEEIKDEYVYLKSSASTNISNIEGFVYGGLSSRFWLYRKHIMCLDYATIKNDIKNPKDKKKKSVNNKK